MTNIDEKKQRHGGARIWYFPDGYLPEKKGEGPMEAHEALMLLNTNPEPAEIWLDFYFEDKPPIVNIQVLVPAERVRCLRSMILGISADWRSRRSPSIRSGCAQM